MTNTPSAGAAAGPSAHKAWEPYIEASLGFRNHWYPAFYSSQLTEGEVRGEVMLGEPIAFKRVNGKVYAVQDRCMHRGVPFSQRPECYTANTLTCWYHGFTYDVRDGALVAVITDPDSALVGKLQLNTYAVEEAKGVVFVFIGDIKPPSLHEDVQPGFLDPDLVLHRNGERQLLKSNWRLGAENGFDASHIYIHRDSAWVVSQRQPMPMATIVSTREGMVVDTPGQPKGVMKGSGVRKNVWETSIEDVPIRARYLPGPDTGRTSPDTSMWLPCGLKVDPFPFAGVIQFEWYVPVDEGSHTYFVTWGTHASSAEQAEKFQEEMDHHWRSLVIDNFNVDDVAAREAMEQFYAHEDGWRRERLHGPDLIITEWRKLASAHNRGIQPKRRFPE
ncbi:MAG: Rieske 2Fe-2S domain-containing protein [Chloroflexi bacterium]|nr:Rieske 2Fe-2S domain-containing protein [Chloroflexota bacterium]